MDINLNYSEDDNPVALKADFILSLCSMAGISKLHTDAATITPAAKPVRARWMPSLRDFFKKNTQPAPRLVPRKGINIPQNASCIM